MVSASLISVMLLAAAVRAQAPGVAGKWDLSVESPHGVMTMGLDLEQKGDQVTGKLIGFMNQDRDVKGQFVKGQLTLATANDELGFTATLKADGSLAGHLSTPQGDTSWKGVRAKKS
jgi:hypothetical protein